MNFPRSESLDEFRNTFQTLNDSSEQTSGPTLKAKLDLNFPQPPESIGHKVRHEVDAPRIPHHCEPTIAELLDMFKLDLEKEFDVAPENTGLPTPTVDDIMSQFREDISRSIDAQIQPAPHSNTVGESEIILSKEVKGGRLFSPANLDEGPILLADNFVEDESDVSDIINRKESESDRLLSDQFSTLNWEEPIVEFIVDPDFDYDSCPRTPRPDLESLVNTYEEQRKRGEPPSLDLLAVHDRVEHACVKGGKATQMTIEI